MRASSVMIFLRPVWKIVAGNTVEYHHVTLRFDRVKQTSSQYCVRA
jgi:hypothetical protein